MMEYNSSSLFSSGVPERMTAYSELMRRAAFEICVFQFLSRCTSSIIRKSVWSDLIILMSLQTLL